jgi:hypothetical protein
MCIPTIRCDLLTHLLVQNRYRPLFFARFMPKLVACFSLRFSAPGLKNHLLSRRKSGWTPLHRTANERYLLIAGSG